MNHFLPSTGTIPAIEKKWWDKLAPFKFPSPFGLPEAFDATVGTIKKLGWELRHADR